MKSDIKVIPLLVLGALAGSLFFISPPEGLPLAGWKLFAVFAFTIIGIMVKAAPLGVMALFGMAWTSCITFNSGVGYKKSIEIALSGFGSPVIWLVVFSFFISRGFIKTGLGNRIAYLFLKIFGKTPLGISYSLNLADLFLAPAIPSNTARGGGIIFPILKSICSNLDSHPTTTESRRKIGAYLTVSTYNGNLITSSMFLTATAGNPIVQKLAQDLGISISWSQWATAAIVPGLITLIIMPWFLKMIYPPTITDTRHAQKEASEKLKNLGPMTRQEWTMSFCFFGLLILWMFGESFGVEATTTGLLGVCFLLFTSILTWKDIGAETGAWDTLIWFSGLVVLGSQLNVLGFIPWLTRQFEGGLSGLHWNIAFPCIVLIYCLSHYLFASATAQVTAMYAGFLSVGISLGVPGKLLALILGMMTSLMGTQTHYGHGTAPVFFGSRFVELKEWWGCGFLLSILYITIFMTAGLFWWKCLGIF